MSYYLEQSQEDDCSGFRPNHNEGCLEGEGECEQHCSGSSFMQLGMTDENNDTADAESGVEPDSSEWIYRDTTESVEFDITAEQAMATLQYFTSTAERANMLTKTHYDDLDVISNLLQEKEKDLEMAARIGQSLLQRNKHLLLKIEAMEDYMNSISERENQLRHDVAVKNDLLKRMLVEEQDFELQSQQSDSDYGYSGEKGCKDESIALLEQKCKNLELQNQELLTEAITLKDMANEAEEQEQDLVVDCMQHLAFAKDQITHLTDEIALKFEDNVAQQEEITQLISTVVELQRKQKQLSIENEDLTYQLEDSQQNQEYLRSQVIDLERRYRECCDLLEQNQDEVKALREQVEYTERDSWTGEHTPASVSQHDSLALEIEECVKRELTASDRNKDKTARVLDTVRKANKFLSPGSNYSPSTPGNLSSAASFKSQSSIDSDDHSVSSVSRSWAGSELDDSRRRKGYIPAEKLQIVKPMEGSITLHKWHHLASENVVAGLNVGNVFTPQRETSQSSGDMSQNSLTDYASTVQNEAGAEARFQISDDEASGSDNDEGDDDVGITFKAKNKPKTSEKRKQSTPIQAVPKPTEKPKPPSVPQQPNLQSGLAGLGGALGSHKSSSKPDRSIITRNSSVLASLREGRAMLNKGDGNGKSRTDAIDILANAMNKANIEAKTGQRILKSMNGDKSRDRASSSSLSNKEYPDMPKLNKVLERLASNNNTGKVDLTAVQPALKMLLEKAASGQKANLPEPVNKTSDQEEKSEKVEATKSDVVLPSLLRGPGNIMPATSILGNILQSNTNENTGTSMLSTVLASSAGQASANVTAARPTLTRSWSSGDLKKFNKDNFARLNLLSSNNDSNDSTQLRQNNSSNALTSLGNTSTDLPVSNGLRRRTNSSGSLTDLVKQADLKPLSASPPNNAAFISFDSYGMGDFSTRGFNTSPEAATTTTTTVSQATTTTTTSAKPGFLRSLFLGSSAAEKPVEPKRPSSAHEVTPPNFSIGAGSSASVESGMNRFGKALAQDGFSGFGFGFMSYFSGSKKSSDGSSSP